MFRKHSVTFPNVLDSSDAATKTAFQDYRTSGVPLNYIIDRDGKIATAWYGYEEGDKRGVEALEKLGVK
jgi:peroxiredoxin